MAFIKVAKIQDIPLGQVRVFEAGDGDIVMCNVEGRIYAIANLCTHDDGPLGEGQLIGNEIECPRHGARFEVQTGAVRSLPAVMPIPTFEVRVEGEDIWVDVG